MFFSFIDQSLKDMYVSLVNNNIFSEYSTTLSANICYHKKISILNLEFVFINCQNPNPTGRYFVFYIVGFAFISFTELEAFGTKHEDKNFLQLETISANPDSSSQYIYDDLRIRLAANIIDGSFYYSKEGSTKNSCSAIKSKTESHMVIHLKKMYKIRRIFIIAGDTEGK